MPLERSKHPMTALCQPPHERTSRPSFPARLVAEGLGSAILVAAVVGSGIMAERLAGGGQAVALLGNTNSEK
jgi:hypothetical protein